MNDNEVNKIIAEYMGLTEDSFDYACMCTMRESCPACNSFAAEELLNKFTTSLDALVPVWEKLTVEFSLIDGHFHILKDNHENDIICTEFVYQKTIQQAAAQATAKCIMELEK